MSKFRSILTVVAVVLGTSAPAASSEIAVQREYRGVRLIALAETPGKRFDASLLPAEEGLRNIAGALDHLIRNSPFSAKEIVRLKKSGRVTLVYKPGDLKNAHGGENVATFMPDYAIEAGKPKRKKDFLVIVGRHGVKWPAHELAATLAHELVGHAAQQRRDRLASIRHVDAECEASMFEEIANQDLGFKKHSRKMVVFRKTLEYRWCADFKAYMAVHVPDQMMEWDTLNPNMPKLLAVFEDYLAHSARIGATAKSINALKRQTRKRRRSLMAGASPEKIFRTALKLRDGAIGVRPAPAEAARYLRLAAENGLGSAWLDVASIHETRTSR